MTLEEASKKEKKLKKLAKKVKKTLDDSFYNYLEEFKEMYESADRQEKNSII